ncbi:MULTISPECIES: hypothetical protein [Yersinia]|uniref:hypothetical protein n=1 Tax=Yersinia TaxID=629 RepID=UPI0013CDFABE|nr:hypothetical protein [Yersinia sp. IP36721]
MVASKYDKDRFSEMSAMLDIACQNLAAGRIDEGRKMTELAKRKLDEFRDEVFPINAK